MSFLLGALCGCNEQIKPDAPEKEYPKCELVPGTLRAEPPEELMMHRDNQYMGFWGIASDCILLAADGMLYRIALGDRLIKRRCAAHSLKTRRKK